MERYCVTAPPDDPLCAAMSEDALHGGPITCTVEAEAAATAMLELNCAELLGPIPTSHEPGTEPTRDCPLSIETFSVSSRASRYQDFADLTLTIRNERQQRVTAWRLRVSVQDVFGEELFPARLTSGSSSIEPGGSATTTFSWEDNQFIRDEPYDYLLSYAEENLRLIVTSCETNFSEEPAEGARDAPGTD